MDFGKLAAEASFIEERRSGGNLVLEKDERSEERFLAWKKLINVVPDKEIFENRLEYSGMTEEDALMICGDVSLRENVDLPFWTEILTDSIHILPAEKEELWRTVSIKRENVELMGPISALLPFLIYAEKHLAQKYRDIPMQDLSDILLKRLYFLCSLTFSYNSVIFPIVFFLSLIDYLK